MSPDTIGRLVMVAVGLLGVISAVVILIHDRRESRSNAGKLGPSSSSR